MDDERNLSKKPANTAFKQQRMRNWQPLLTPKTVLPTFFLVGVLFVPLGIVLYIASSKVTQLSFDYTGCATAGSDWTAPSDSTSGIISWKYNHTSNVCSIQFSVPSDIPAPVFMYYRLTNFFQNNRRYVKSFDSSQLLGNYKTVSNLDPGCDPLKTVPTDGSVWVMFNGTNTTINSSHNAQYYPCGLIANSLFSDTNNGNLTCVSGCGTNSTNTNTYVMTNANTAWPSDVSKYGVMNPSSLASPVETTLIPPPYWRTAFPQWADGYTANNLPNLQTWQEFQVWMRTAGLPTFRKLWKTNLNNYLPQGTWSMDITESFDVSRFSGTKSIVITSVSLLGGKNSFLGVAYISVGTICWALGIAFLARHLIKPRKLGDHTYLSWNQPQASARPTNSTNGRPNEIS